MKQQFTRTLFIKDLAEAKVSIMVLDKPKYEDNANQIDTVEIEGIKSWTIYTEEEAKALESVLGMVDENHEYLEIEKLNGAKEFYKNSNVILFVR